MSFSSLAAYVPAAQDQLDGVGQLVHARGKRSGLGLGHDRLELRDRRAALQRDRHGADHSECDVDGGEVDAVEAQRGDPVARLHPVVGKGARQGVDTFAQFTVGDGVEAGEQPQHGAAGLGVLEELDGALSEGATVCVTFQHGLNDLRQSQSRLFEGGGDRRVGPGCGELWVVSGQVLDAAFEPLFTSSSRHNSSLHY